MNKKVGYIILIFVLTVYSSLIIAQSPYHQNNFLTSNYSLSINDYSVSDYKTKSSSNFIRMDSIISTSVQGSGLKHIFRYNANNKITEWLILGNFGSGWFNNYINNLIYDNQNNLITEINLDWNGTAWDSSSRIKYSYKTGMLSQSVFQIYVNNSRTNLTQRCNIYDSNGNLLTTVIEVWTNDGWQNSTLITNYYSLQNQRDSILFRTWTNSNWQNDKKTVYYYSGNQIDLDSLVVKSWNGVSWINYLKREIINDKNHNQIEQLDEIWNYNSWLNSIKRYFTYSESNFIDYAYCEIWSNNKWMKGDGDILFQNPDGFSVVLITNNVFAFYSDIVGIDENEDLIISDFSLSQNYPNPFNPETTINYSIPSVETTRSRSGGIFTTLKVYDILGNEVAALVNEERIAGKYSVKFNAKNLSSGVYFYKLQAGIFTQTKKFILLK